MRMVVQGGGVCRWSHSSSRTISSIQSQPIFSILFEHRNTSSKLYRQSINYVTLQAPHASKLALRHPISNLFITLQPPRFYLPVTNLLLLPRERFGVPHAYCTVLFDEDRTSRITEGCPDGKHCYVVTRHRRFYEHKGSTTTSKKPLFGIILAYWFRNSMIQALYVLPQACHAPRPVWSSLKSAVVAQY